MQSLVSLSQFLYILVSVVTLFSSSASLQHKSWLHSGPADFSAGIWSECCSHSKVSVFVNNWSVSFLGIRLENTVPSFHPTMYSWNQGGLIISEKGCTCLWPLKVILPQLLSHPSCPEGWGLQSHCDFQIGQTSIPSSTVFLSKQKRIRWKSITVTEWSISTFIELSEAPLN